MNRTERALFVRDVADDLAALEAATVKIKQLTYIIERHQGAWAGVGKHPLEYIRERAIENATYGVDGEVPPSMRQTKCPECRGTGIRDTGRGSGRGSGRCPCPAGDREAEPAPLPPSGPLFDRILFMGNGAESAQSAQRLRAQLNEAIMLLGGLQQPPHSESDEEARRAEQEYDEGMARVRALAGSITKALVGSKGVI